MDGVINFQAESNRNRVRGALLIVAALLFAFCPAGAAADWKVGLASVKITPEKPIRMAGYASRETPSEGVDADLYANALALEDRDGNRALLITADLIGFVDTLSESICRKLKNSDGIERKSILLNASHTHTGPTVAVSRIDSYREEEQEVIREYVAGLEEKVVEIAQKALRNLKPAKLSWGQGVAKFVMNRREPTPEGIRLGVNARGLADRTVPVLRVDTPEGELRAVVFGAASHCTTLTGNHMKITGDYAGFAQAYLEQRYRGVQAMFVTGCAGNANPYPRGKLEFAKRHGRDLGAAVERVLFSELQPVNGPIRTRLRRVKLPLQRFTRAEIEAMAKDAPSYRQFFTDRALAMLDRGESLPKTYDAPFALWQFGDDLTLVGYSGETLVEYATMAERDLGPLNIWIAGYCNDVFGYLPSVQALAAGGYETRGLYMGVGLFAPNVEQVVMKAIVEMARSAGRKIPAAR